MGKICIKPPFKPVVDWTDGTNQKIRAVEFDFRRRVVDDIEEMLDKAGAFQTEVYVVDEDGSPGQRVHDVEDHRDATKLRRMAEALADYVIGEK
jgi:hypothetical protein